MSGMICYFGNMESLSSLEVWGIFSIFVLITVVVTLIIVLIIEPLVDKLKNVYDIWRYGNITCHRCGNVTPYYRTYGKPRRRFEAIYCACCGEKLLKRRSKK